MTYLPITDHGLIGDLHTAALVGVDGRLVWLPWPHFCSPSLFASVLDDQRGGEWLLAPDNVVSTQQRYAGRTAVLITSFETPTGSAELWDWMSPYDHEAPGHDLCRELRCTAGEIDVVGRFAPRPDYARELPKLEINSRGLQFEAHDLTLYLAVDRPWELEQHAATLRTHLRAGEQLRCVLSSGAELVPVDAVPADLEATERFWRDWMEYCTYNGPWAEEVRRSAITLKLLTYAPTGAIVAAPTTSLPEWIGGERNWDYRFTWLRDASLTLDALCSIGYHREESHFFEWLNDLARKHEAPLQIMYGIQGEVDLHEVELDHLSGYMGSRPVRIGNGAHDQRQLDVYGGVIDAAMAYEHHRNRLTPQQWAALKDEIEYVAAHWNEPDQGIWEMRGPPQNHTFSKLMCWVALDRGINLAEHERWDYDHDHWLATRDAIHRSILEHAWNEELGAFTQAYGSRHLDASVLMLALMKFLPPDDPRIRSTVMRIKEHLSDGALVYRYHSADGVRGEEGAFLLCSFWLVNALTLIGEREAACEHFNALLQHASTHGLLSEEVDPRTGTALGNYPQAFSHIGLINAALNLSITLEDSEAEPGLGSA